MELTLLKKTTVLLLGLFLSFEVFVTIRNFAVQLGDLHLYYDLSAYIIVQGKVPYRDFGLEYPPFAIFPMLLPQLLCQIGATGFRGFVVFFAIQNLMVGLCIGQVLFHTAKAFLKEPEANEIRYIYWILWGISLPIFLFRYDGFVALSTLLVIYCIANRFPFAAGIWLTVGIFAKLYPLVFLSPIVLFYFVNKQYRFLFLFLGGIAMLTLLIIFGMYHAVGGDFLLFLKYHKLRGIQVESFVGGGLTLLYKIQGVIPKTIANYGAIHLVIPGTAFFLKVMSWGFPIAYLLLSGVIYYFFNRQNQVPMQTLLVAMGSTLLAFVIFNKVFSPQYLIWLLPIIPFLSPKILYCFAAAFVLTIIIYPGSYHRLVEMKLLWVIMLNLRNGLIAAIMLLVVWSMPYLRNN